MQTLKISGLKRVKGEIVEPLNVFSYEFSSFLDHQEELVHSHLVVILIESREEPGFQVNSRIDGAVGNASKPIKDYLFKN